MDGSGPISIGSTLLLWVDAGTLTTDDPDFTVALFPDAGSAINEALKILHDQSEGFRKIPVVFYHYFEPGPDDKMTLFDAIHKHLPKH